MEKVLPWEGHGPPLTPLAYITPTLRLHYAYITPILRLYFAYIFRLYFAYTALLHFG